MSRAGALIRILLTLKILVLIDVQWKKKKWAGACVTLNVEGSMHVQVYKWLYCLYV